MEHRRYVGVDGDIDCGYTIEYPSHGRASPEMIAHVERAVESAKRRTPEELMAMRAAATADALKTIRKLDENNIPSIRARYMRFR